MMADLNSRARGITLRAVKPFPLSGRLTAFLPCGLAAGVLCWQNPCCAEVNVRSAIPPLRTEIPQSPEALPATPAELFNRLSEATRPQWRQFYRPTVNRCQEGRRQAAMALGAVCADLYLASQARDAQQVRNLLQDQATIEKSLGLNEPMAKARQRIAAAAEQSQWKVLQTHLAELPAQHLRHLRSQKDEELADFTCLGQWVRCLQICHEVVLARKLDDYRLAIGSVELIDELKRRLTLVSHEETEPVRCLRLLHRRLEGMERLWRAPVPAEGMDDRLQRSASLLGDTMDDVVQDPP